MDPLCGMLVRVRRLDGKVLVVSNDDNSIPYDTWDKIRDLFNGWNIHLG